MTEEYYIRNKERTPLGNAPMWWKIGGHGYSPYLEDAQRFYVVQAIELVNRAPDKFAMHRCNEVDRRLHAVFDCQELDMLANDPKDDPWDIRYINLERARHETDN